MNFSRTKPNAPGYYIAKFSFWYDLIKIDYKLLILLDAGKVKLICANSMVDQLTSLVGIANGRKRLISRF